MNPGAEQGVRRTVTRLHHNRRRARADRELEEWIDGELDFYVKGLINDGDLVILRRNLIRIAQAERRRT